MERYLEKFKNCLQKEIPFCQAECPFQMDILDFMEKMKRGGFGAAYKTYRNAVGFPGIVSNLCHEPCKGVCPGRNWDREIDLKMLEKAAISFSENKEATAYNLPVKKKKVAVIGAGISGLACALRLCMKKYEVEIFESQDRIGGYLWELLPPEIFLPDIEKQFKHEKYILHLETPVNSVGDLDQAGFDAVYVATGEGGLDFGLMQEPEKVPDKASGKPTDKYCRRVGKAGWFAGGGLTGEKPVYALANGLFMGTVIDNFLKTDNLLYPANVQHTSMCLDPSHLNFAEPVNPKEGNDFSREEAEREARRCIECKCDSCRVACDLTEFYNKWPLRIRDEIIATTLPGSAEVKATPAKRLLSTCSQCGLCRETCPEEIDLGGLILAGRKSMHQQKKTAWVFHDFWLRDMDSANSPLSAVVKVPKSKEETASKKQGKCSYAFFPGCQIGASDPLLVEKAYQYLLKKNPDTGLFLRCCGVPAEWSGDEEKFRTEMAELHHQWTNLGEPTLIVACPTCLKKFKEHMKDIPVISLYEIIVEWGFGNPDLQKFVHNQLGKGERNYSVFDPCASIHEPGMKSAIRKLAEDAGYLLEPLPGNDAFPRCCSYGGQPAVANPRYAEFVTMKRIHESENPYITYCTNCRDSFLESGKETVHILDILFGLENSLKKVPTISERRENRQRLKTRLLREFWGEESAEIEHRAAIILIIPADLAEKLGRLRILTEDIENTVEFCENTGRKIRNSETGSFSGYRQIGYMTYWVEYKKTPDKGVFELSNAYSHRMKIELEPVWNGNKMDYL